MVDTFIIKLFKGCKIACFALLMTFSVIGCGTVTHIPVETDHITITNYIDSLRIKDTTIVHTENLIKDYSGLLDTLYLEGKHSSAVAYADTSKNMLKGELREDKWKERVLYKDRYVYKTDTLVVYEQVPYEVEKPVKFIPSIYKWTFWICILEFVLLIAVFILKFKKII